MNTDIGIILASCPDHKPWMDQCFKHLEDSPWPIAFGWDGEDLPTRPCPPAVKARFCSGGKLGHQLGEAWQILVGARLLGAMGCRYVLKTSTDQTLDNIDELKALIPYMEDCDILTCSESFNVKKTDEEYPKIDTLVFLGKTESVINLFARHWAYRMAGKKPGKRLEGELFFVARELKIRRKMEFSFFREVLNVLHFYCHTKRRVIGPEGAPF